jgi:hypothetical protein
MVLNIYNSHSYEKDFLFVIIMLQLRYRTKNPPTAGCLLLRPSDTAETYCLVLKEHESPVLYTNSKFSP